MMMVLMSGAPAYAAALWLTFTSVLLAGFAASPFSLWLMMEFGVCCFCGLLAFVEPYKGEGVAKYFVPNSLAGSGLLCTMFSHWGNRGEVLSEMVGWMFLVCLYIKLGLPPFHFWVIGVLRCCTWELVFLLLTLQKVLPLVFLGWCVELSSGILFVALVSALMAGFGGLGHHEPFLIFGYTSMLLTNWLVLVASLDLEALLGCFMIYLCSFFILLGCFQEKKFKSWFGEFSIWTMLALVLMMGVPNGPIFLLKVWVYQSLLSSGYIIGAWGVALTSILLLPLYMRVMSLVVLGAYTNSANESASSGWVMYPMILTVFIFFFSGVGWAMWV